MQEAIEIISKNKEVLFYCFILLILILLYTVFQIYIRMGIYRATVLIVGTFLLIMFLLGIIVFVDRDLKEKYSLAEIDKVWYNGVVFIL